MTEQVEQTFWFNKKRYEVKAIRARTGWLFDPDDVGLAPQYGSTCCCRGYQACYSLDSHEQLILKWLLTNNGYEEVPWVSPLRHCPEINGIKPVLVKNNIDGPFFYRNLQLPINYSGGILIARLLEEGEDGSQTSGSDLYRPGCYREVLGLVFRDGILRNTRDHSALAKLCRTVSGIPYGDCVLPGEQTRDIHRWVRDGFGIR